MLSPEEDFVRRCRLPTAGDGTCPPDAELPLIIDVADVRGVDEMAEHLERWQPKIDARLRRHGAVLLRGFRFASPAEFEALVPWLVPSPAERHYFDDGIRRWLAPHTFSVADVPGRAALTPLPFHNEDSFVPCSPARLAFGCVLPARWGGETPLVDCRRVLRDIPERVLRKLSARYDACANFPAPVISHNMGISDREELRQRVTALARGAEASWEGDTLQVRFLGGIAIRHSDTGEVVWYNRVKGIRPDAWALDVGLGIAMSALAVRVPAVAASIAELYQACVPHLREILMDWSRSPLTSQDLYAIVRAHWRNAVALRWQPGDIVVIDNRLVAHARLPFLGARQLVGALSSPSPVTYVDDDLAAVRSAPAPTASVA